MILFDKKLPVNHPSLKGYEKTIAKYNTDRDPATISLRELDRAHSRLETRYRDVEDWGPLEGPVWAARYEAAAIENVMDQIRLETRGPVSRAVGTGFAVMLMALGWYPQGK